LYNSLILVIKEHLSVNCSLKMEFLGNLAVSAIKLSHNKSLNVWSRLRLNT